jgi:ASC-1-like (ASCH) protein
MKKQSEMLDEYDFSKGIRGKYAKAYHEGVNIVKIDEDVTKVFPDSKSVNEALRTLMRLLAKNRETAQSA